MSDIPRLRRELGLRDMTLFAISCIVGTRWIALAAHAGPGSVTLFALGAVFFVVPLAVATGTLSVRYPGTGGFYVWARRDFGAWHGFLSAWVYWFSIAFWFPSAALFYMSAGLHAFGPGAAHLADNRIVLVAISLAAIWIPLLTNLVGMKVGKWTENLGGAAAWLLVGGLALAALIAFRHSGSATHLDPLPHASWGVVSFWATIAYAMTGLELAGLMGGEIHRPEQTLPRAGWISSIFITFFYLVATGSVLVLLRPEQVSEIHGLSQAATAAQSLSGIPKLGTVLNLLVLASAVGQFGGLIASVSRLPYAAAVDGLLPKAFARVHPRWHTPHWSILCFGAVASFLLVIFQLGDTFEAAYQELVSLMVIAGFLPYIYMFGGAWKAGKRLSALSGWAVTVLAVTCSAVPTEAVTSVWLFEGKLAAAALGIIGLARIVFNRYCNVPRHRGTLIP
jgi:amino acid transporter